MQIAKFKIKNYKGIVDTEIALSDGTPGNIEMLIGLNESGKTTILEAISQFGTEIKEIAEIVRTVHKKSSLQDAIPKDKKAAFSGKISIQATLVIEPSDISYLKMQFEKHKNLILDETRVPKFITVERAYEFEDSQHKQASSIWHIEFFLKKNKSVKFKKYDHGSKSSSDDKEIWQFGATSLRDRLPEIVYFPTFLFNFPDRIYLEETPKNIDILGVGSNYKRILQGILDSQGKNLSIEKHIIGRIARLKATHLKSPNFLNILLASDERKLIDAVVQEISTEISRIIFGSWNKIFGKNLTGKRIQIDWGLDYEKNNALYVELSIIDGQIKYALSERSLGFRWFFSFLLFTQFRISSESGKSVIFLFDEPAANLHSKAQMRLLESFPKIAKDSNHLIYSTHSHYMVNPLWLDKSYIIQNSAVDHDDKGDIDVFDVRVNDIKAIKYKTFVGKYPSKTTYFQPVLDSLDIGISKMMSASRAVIVEGKYDYHPLIYFCRMADEKNMPDIFPAVGAGGMGTLINLFRGWGVEFKILLDDDRAGRIAKQKYIEEYFVLERQISTLADIDPILLGKDFEIFYQDDVKEKVREKFGIDKIQKKHFSMFFQDIIFKDQRVDCLATSSAIAPLIKWVMGRVA